MDGAEQEHVSNYSPLYIKKGTAKGGATRSITPHLMVVSVLVDLTESQKPNGTVILAP